MAAVLVTGSVLLLGSTGVAVAAPRPDQAPVAAQKTAAAQKTIAGYAPFYRATIQQGAQDGDAFQIRNVRELQYRLRWSGVYTGPVTGKFGPRTETGVKTFQRGQGLRATGVADLATWQRLIQITTKQLAKVPAMCRKSGWQSCYDRPNHQLFTYLNGTLWNVWLVRGGSSTEQTRLGSFRVFARYPKKKSTIYESDMYWFQKFNGAQGVHGSVSMADPFVGHSHGCVNMYINDAKVLWDMTADASHAVTVYGAWA